MKLDIAAIRARADAATAGPWTLGGYSGSDQIRAPVPIGQHGDESIFDQDGDETGQVYVIIESDGGMYWRRDCARRDKADREFITAARSDVPALCDEVERLRAEREHLRELAKKVRDYWRANPGHARDGISTPGMLLLMAVEKP